MNQAKRYCLLHVPESGLFHDGRRFKDGDGRKIEGHGAIAVYRSRDAASRRKKELAAEGKKYIIIGFEPIEKGTDK